ncbi:MAG: metal ABC transporter substrate-binding protein [Yaniella sp.]|uniref:metal ABC transporter substrate-binding protein n=1 Tax=Yaniella sp. TaxID=2773929 RepID=UPI003F99B54D
MNTPRNVVAGIATAAIAGLLLTSCGDTTEASDSDETLSVYATTGYLADAVENIAPDAEVTTMVGPGADPHTYQPSTRDIETIQDADVVLWNGLYLEAQMIELLESQGERQLAAAEQIPEDMLLSWPETDDEGNPLNDPHVWNSPDAWAIVVDEVADKLAELDSENAEAYRANAADYQDEIVEAAAEVEELLATVAEPRMLITGHDAFNYFGDTYDLDVHATDFVSSEAALSAEELSELAELIADYEVPVIFEDNQANPQAITSLQEAVERLGWQVEISEAELYADSLGAEDGVDTYLGVFRHNAQAVADALGDE